jgi:hypothetical protein
VGHRQSTRRPVATRFVSGSGSRSPLSNPRKRRSSVLRVTWMSPCCARQRVDAEHRSEIDQGPRHGGDRDGENRHRILRVDASTAAGNEALNEPFGESHHLGRGCRASQQAMQMRSGPPTQQRARADAPLDLARRDSRRQEGAASHHAMPLTAEPSEISSTVLPSGRMATLRQDDRRPRPRAGYPVPPWRRGGVATQRPAKPFTPVRFRSAPSTTAAPARARRPRPSRGSRRSPAGCTPARSCRRTRPRSASPR